MLPFIFTVFHNRKFKIHDHKLVDENCSLVVSLLFNQPITTDDFCMRCTKNIVTVGNLCDSSSYDAVTIL